MASKVVLAQAKDRNLRPLYVVRYRMPSQNRKSLSEEEKEKYSDAYINAWVRLGRLGLKDTTSTILTRKPRDIIEKTIKEAMEEYEKRGLTPPEFSKTPIAEEEEESWLTFNSLLRFID